MRRHLFTLNLILVAACCARLPLAAQTRGTSVQSQNFFGGPYSSVTLPAWNVVTGNTVIVAIRFASEDSVSAEDTAGNSFTVVQTTASYGENKMTMFKAENVRGMTGDVITITFSGGGGYYTSQVAVQYSGTASSAYDTGAEGIVDTLSYSVTSAAFTTSQLTEMIVACGTSPNGSAPTATTNGIAMNLAAIESTYGLISCHDLVVYTIQPAVRSTITSTSSTMSQIVVGTLKAANPVSPPTMTEAFSHQTASIQGIPYVYQGQSAAVSFTISNGNPSATLTGIAFSDTLPTNMVVATPNGITGSCPSGTVSATAGGSTISLSGASLTAGSNCTFTVNVSSTGAGQGVNTTGQVTSTTSGAGIGPTATATLTMYQTPSLTISGIGVNALSHASMNLTYSVSASAGTGYCQVLYGLSSGNYTYVAENAPANYPLGWSSNGCQITLGGLAPDTTYYMSPTVRVSANNTPWTADVCQQGGSCGATEQVFTTSALPAVHPAPPIAPTTWTPTEPDTSSYTVVSMQAAIVAPPGGSVGDCVAASNVAKQRNWTSAVNANDPIQTVLNEIWFDTALEFAEGSSCNVPQAGSFHTGVALPVYSPSGGANDWVMFRTHQNGAADFPPFGTRTGPQYASRLATLMTLTPGMPLGLPCGAPSCASQNFNGQLFDCYQENCNHFWWENLTFDHAYNSTLYPPGVVDPPAFVDYIRFQPAVFTASLPPSTTPDHNVIDRIYIPGQPYPAREMGCFVPGGTYWAIVNSYCVTNFQTVGVLPTTGPTSLGTTISVPQNTFRLNAFDASPIGMNGPATIECTGANCSTYTGAFQAWLGSGGLTFEYATAAGVSFTCFGCTALSAASPTLADIPAASMMYFGGAFAAGSVNFYYEIYGVLQSNSPSQYTQFRPIGIYAQPSQYGVYDNNYMQAIGQTIYNDTSGPFLDIVWTHNYFYFPRSQMQFSGSWNGYGYSFRNVIESKQQTRGLYRGNIIDGSASFKNPGNAVALAGAYAGPFSTGDQDISITGNIFKHISSGFQTAGAGSGGPPDSPTGLRYAITNNFWLDMNRGIYNNQANGISAGLNSGTFSSYPMMEDLVFSNNTIGLASGANFSPSLLYIGWNAGNTSGFGEGLQYSSNVALASLAEGDLILAVDGGQNASYNNFPTNPTLVPSQGSPAPAGTWQNYLNSGWTHIGATISPSWSLNRNVVVGAQTLRGGPAADLTPAGVTSYIQQLWPSADTTTVFPCSSADPWLSTRCPNAGATMANRLSAIGWSPTLNVAGGNPIGYPVVPTVYNPGNLGANVTTVNQATGIVNNIALSAASTAISVTYTAPDSRACSADVSPSGAGTWTRLKDGGGAFTRSLTFTGLLAFTAYDYRLLCYFDQSAAYEFLPAQITSGTISTAASLTKTVYTTFTLPSGASKAVVSFAPLPGSPVSSTCSTSPCAVASVPAGKNIARTITFRTSAGVTVGIPSTVGVTVN